MYFSDLIFAEEKESGAGEEYKRVNAAGEDKNDS